MKVLGFFSWVGKWSTQQEMHMYFYLSAAYLFIAAVYFVHAMNWLGNS